MIFVPPDTLTGLDVKPGKLETYEPFDGPGTGPCRTEHFLVIRARFHDGREYEAELPARLLR